jgi:hypothetical protein
MVAVALSSVGTLPCELGWVSRVNFPGWNRLSHNAASSGDCTLLKLHSWAYDCFRADPAAITQSDRLDDEAKSRIRPVVVPRAQISALGNANILTDPNRREVVNPAILA